jgi:energy-coupling factor transporter ATP-binding protein EcfA2
VFFGREREIARLVELLQPTLQRGAGRFVGIVGPSGSGKSSLLRAGLLPRLHRSPGRWVLLPPLQPGRRPTRDLAGCLARAFAANGAPRSTEDLAAVLDEGSAGLQKVAEELSKMAEPAGGGTGRPNVLVVLDQAEELLTRTGPVEQHAFLDLVTGALAEDSPPWVVATVRSEFLSSAPDRAGLAEAIDDTLVIEPLSRARLAEVIVRPARRAGLEFAPGLVERMVQDTAGGDALPLLAHTLRESGERAGPDGWIGIADYDAVGGVVGALRNRADRVADELGRRGHGELVVPALVRLATVTGQDEPTRRRVRRSTLTAEEQAVVDAFVDARLLTSDHAPAAATDEAPGDATVEVAHEALLRQWPPLGEAIEADRTGLQLRSELERLAADWERANRDDAYLLRGARLAVFEEWAGTCPGGLESFDTAQGRDTERSRDVGVLQAEFVRRSRARERREVRRWRIVAAVLAVLVLTAGTLTFVAVSNAAQITAQLATANAEAIARESGARLGRDPLLAAELALVAWRSDPASAQARSALADAYVALAGADSVVYTQPGRQPIGLITTDGELLGAVSLPSGISVTTGVLGPDPAPLNLLHGLTFAEASPDGSGLAVIGEDGVLRLHDIDGSEPPSSWPGRVTTFARPVSPRRGPAQLDLR